MVTTSDVPAMGIPEMLKHVGTDLEKGLSEEDVKARQAKFGKNCLPEEPPKPLLELIIAQFEDVMVRLLLAAACVSFALAIFEDDEDEKVTAFVEPLVILAILTANATVGVVQELNADEALRELMTLSAPSCVVVRDGKEVNMAASELVVGDVIVVGPGDQVPADARVANIVSTTIRLDQSNLTGESHSIIKHADPVEVNLQQKEFYLNTVYSSTYVTYGKAKCVVTKTGLDTEFGAIFKGTKETEEEKTPLQHKLDDFGETLTKVISAICVFVWLVNFNNFASKGSVLKGCIFYAKQGVALAVAALPEGLPAVVTTCLALGTRRMAKKNAVVRKLPSVETLGCTTVICSDKTGTLTTNKMVVRRVATYGGNGVNVYTVNGTSFNPVVDSKWSGGAVNQAELVTLDGKGLDCPLASDKAMKDLATVCSVCNEASLAYNEEEQQVERVNEAMEAALLVAVEKLGLEDGAKNAALRSISDPKKRLLAVNEDINKCYTKNGTLEFTRERKSMSVHVTANGRDELLVKGAPDCLLDRCTHVKTAAGQVQPLTAAIKKEILESYHELATGGESLRCLGMATKASTPYASLTGISDPNQFATIESGLTFVGFVGILDPPRREVKGAIQECETAHVRVIVITGDNKDTAEGICREIGLFKPGESTEGLSFTGQQFDSMTVEEQLKAVKTAKLFARAVPDHKKVITERLQACGFVCAMTGDGVNDALALKKANIGIGMGSGTEVAKKSSDMILADDNFSTIVSAIEEGRTIYNNTKQFIRYLISSNIGEVVCIFLTGCMGMPEVLVPIQLLWVNLVTDGLPATALGFNPPEPDVMKKAPRRSDEAIITRGTFVRYMVIGTYVGLATVGGFAFWCMYAPNGPMVTFQELCGGETGTHEWLDNASWEGGKKVPMTVALSVLVTVEMFNALNALGDSSLLQVGPLSNLYLIGAIVLSFSLHFLIMYVPAIAGIFGVWPLDVWSWKLIVALSVPIVFVDEVMKIFVRRGEYTANASQVKAKTE
eukprot:TRINITY_DN132_c0_g4_i2.p1 TRINITY_DN132_c0_g4~~TRINITY_DN132_c0_g4_i2.p1  ORF type:complete len:1011 (+),score=500.82 TRINITY_DN132_c0_g4_i2:63-3095(+)